MVFDGREGVRESQRDRERGGVGKMESIQSSLLRSRIQLLEVLTGPETLA